MSQCVYTALVGNYERINEQPVAKQSSIRFICFTDDPKLRSDTWEVRLVEPAFARDAQRSQRDLKIRPHIHLPSFAQSVYIDNSVILTKPPNHLFELLATSRDGFLTFPHSLRETVLDEFLAVAEAGLDDNGRIFEQLNHYLLSHPEILEEKPWWGGFLIRDHQSPRLRQAMEVWNLHVMRYSRRDQLSLNFALRVSRIVPTSLNVDIRRSDFHMWPHAVDRDHLGGDRNPAFSLMPLPARLRVAEQRMQADDARHRADIATREAELEAIRAELTARTIEAASREAELNAVRADLVVHKTDAASRAELASREINLLSAQLAELSSRHNALLASTSWRLTRPLRYLRRHAPRTRSIFRGTFR